MNYSKVYGPETKHQIIIYTLSTCSHCNKTKRYLKEKKQQYKYIDVDNATREEKREITRFLRANNLQIAFPVIVIDDKIIQGFKEKELEEILQA